MDDTGIKTERTDAAAGHAADLLDQISRVRTDLEKYGELIEQKNRALWRLVADTLDAKYGEEGYYVMAAPAADLAPSGMLDLVTHDAFTPFTLDGRRYAIAPRVYRLSEACTDAPAVRIYDLSLVLEAVTGHRHGERAFWLADEAGDGDVPLGEPLDYNTAIVRGASYFSRPATRQQLYSCGGEHPSCADDGAESRTVRHPTFEYFGSHPLCECWGSAEAPRWHVYASAQDMLLGNEMPKAPNPSLPPSSPPSSPAYSPSSPAYSPYSSDACRRPRVLLSPSSSDFATLSEDVSDDAGGSSRKRQRTD